MSKHIIRNIERKDNQSLIDLVHKTLSEFGAVKGDGFAMDDEELLDMYASYELTGKHFYVVENEGEILGGAGVAPLEDNDNPNYCELRKMYFSPQLRGQGMGKILIDKCINKAKELGYKGVYLETISAMKVAQKLYQSRGFEYLDHRMGNTGHHACGVFMLKHI
ncbi:MAG: GNAT family N-acetyltransferase [Marinicellaceae bacterium]